MNKFITQTLIFITLLVSSNTLITMMPKELYPEEPYLVYIENHYGAPIKFKTAPTKEKAEETAVANMQRGLVGGQKIKSLSIRTTGTGSTYLSPFTDISQYLKQIRNEAEKQTEDENKDAIIIIKPSKNYQNWDIEVNWEKQDKNIQLLPAEEEMIAAIINGSFGPDYAQKVMNISYFKAYWIAEADGHPNLNNLLTHYVRTFIIKKNDNPHQAAQFEQDLKNNIDDLHNALEKYKKRYRTS